jgi:hypothetical protein
MILLILVFLLLFGGTLAAGAEPISAAIAITSAILSTTVVGTITIGTIVANVAIAVGLSLVSSLLQPSRGDNAAGFDAGAQANSAETRYTVRQSIPFKRVIVGSAYVGFAVHFEDFKAPYFTIGGLISEGPIAGVDKIWIGTNQLSFAALTADTVLTPIAVDGQPDYPSRVQVSFGLGADAQALDPIIGAEYTSIGATYRQRGIARFSARAHIGADQPEYVSLYGNNARPNFFLLARGVPAYDPRDPTQDIADEATWTWTNNASLIQIWYVTRDFGGRIPMAKIDWDKVAEAADYDDELVGVKGGGFIKRYTADGVITLNQRPYDVMLSLLSANRGMLLQAGGKVWVTSSKPKTPIATIHDGVLASGISYRDAKPKRDLINKLQVRFVATEQDYQTVDGPILVRSDLVASDGETLQGTLDLPFTLDHRRAQRLQKAFLDTARLGKNITCRVDITWLADLDDEPIGNAITFDSDLFSLSNGTYLCTSSGFADDFSAIELALTEYDRSIETDWDPATDEQDFTLASLDLT